MNTNESKFLRHKQNLVRFASENRFFCNTFEQRMLSDPILPRRRPETADSLTGTGTLARSHDRDHSRANCAKSQFSPWVFVRSGASRCSDGCRFRVGARYPFISRLRWFCKITINGSFRIRDGLLDSYFHSHRAPRNEWLPLKFRN